MIQGFEAYASDPELGEWLGKRSEPDAPTFLKTMRNLESKLGTTINPPAKDAKPEEIKAFTEKVYATGHIKPPTAFPDHPDKYEVKFSDAYPKHAINEELVGEYKQIAHKYGLPQDAVKDLIALNEKQFAGIAEVIKVNEQASRERVDAKAKEYSTDGAKLMAAVDNFLSAKGYSEDQLAQLKQMGLLLDAPVLELLIDAAMNSREADGIMNGTAPGIEAEQEEILAAMRILNDPKHPDFAKYNTKEWNDKIDAYWKKKTHANHGSETAQFQIS